MTTDYIRLHAMTTLMTTAITKSITTLMTTAITRDYKVDDKVDDNISLPGIAGYVLSDKSDKTPAAVRPERAVRLYPLAR